MARTERFLAAGSRLVVRARNGNAVWHTTTKDVIVENPAFAVCPITHTTVDKINLDGFDIFFPGQMVRRREILEPGDTNDAVIAGIRPVLFTYDIPDEAIMYGPDGRPILNRRQMPLRFPNPSPELRRYAIRLNWSNWIMSENDIPHVLISQMLDSGCDPWTFKFDPSETRKLVTAAIGSLRKEIAEAQERAAESRARAEEQLNSAIDEEGITPEEAEERYLARALAIETRIAALTEDLNAVAERFGINPQILELGALTDTGSTLRKEMEERARGYVAGIKALRETGSSYAEPMARAMESNEVPLGVVADALRDVGKFEEASKLLAVMGLDEAGMPLPVESEVPAESDGTFSLVGFGTDEE